MSSKTTLMCDNCKKEFILFNEYVDRELISVSIKLNFSKKLKNKIKDNIKSHIRNLKYGFFESEKYIDLCPNCFKKLNGKFEI